MIASDVLRLCFVALVSSGCVSFVAVSGPEPSEGFFGLMINNDPERVPICTETFAPVVVDAAFALAWIPLAVFTEPAVDGFGRHEAAITGGVLLGGLSMVSAVLGARDVVRCRRAVRRWHATHPQKQE